MIKLLISDVDGTLLYNAVGDTPLPHIAESLEQLDRHGIGFMLASGRYDLDLKAVEAALPRETVGYRIGMNGATIIKDNKEIIQNLSLSAVDVENILHFYRKHRPNGKYIQSTQENSTAIFEAFGKKGEFAEGSFLVSCTNPEGEIYKYFISDTVEHTKKWNDMIDRCFPQFGVYQSSSYTSEISPSEANKGNAVIKLARLHGIDMDEIAFVGDSGNDVSAFNTAGKSFCMRHAATHIQAEADVLVDDVAEAIAIILAEHKE